MWLPTESGSLHRHAAKLGRGHKNAEGLAPISPMERPHCCCSRRHAWIVHQHLLLPPLQSAHVAHGLREVASKTSAQPTNGSRLTGEAGSERTHALLLY